jgi:hypothetical protein
MGNSNSWSNPTQNTTLTVDKKAGRQNKQCFWPVRPV